MKIRNRTPLEIKKHQKILKKSVFGLEELKNKFRAERRKPKKIFIIQKQTKCEPNFKFYKNGFVYKTMNKDKYKMWRELFDKGISVEPIQNVGSKILNEIKNEIKDNNFKIADDQILVKSKAVGQNYFIEENKITKFKSLVTIEKLIKNKIIPQLTNEQKNSISFQITKITLQLLENDYIHSHPHKGNWTVDITSKKPKVYLIDFDKIQKIEHKRQFMILYKDLLEVGEMVSNIRTGKIENKMYSLISKKFNEYILRRNKKLRLGR